MTWITCAEAYPPDDYVVLLFVYTHEGSMKKIMTGFRKCGEWKHSLPQMHINSSMMVTHWMELPDYPVAIELPKDVMVG